MAGTAQPTAPLPIVFAIPALDHGGPDRVMYELLVGLDRTKFAPSLLVSEPEGYYRSRLPADIQVHVLPRAPSWLGRYPVFQALRFVRQTAPAIVFATLRMTLTLGMAASAFPKETRLILRQANDLSADFAVLIKKSPLKHRLSRQIAMAALRRADAVVCQSEAMRTDLRAQLGDRADLHVINNPVNIEAIERSSSLTRPQLPGSPALVSVGRLAPQKGFDILLPAFAQLRTTHPGAHLTVLGDGPDRSNLEAQARSLGLATAVTFTGFASEPIPMVQAADLFVLASRYEGFPNAALEALACGTPVVLTDCPGANREIVMPGVNGQLAPEITSRAMAAAMVRAISELPYDRARIISACRERFAASRILGQYEHLFSAVAERRS